jgi:hypothetical protein
MRRTAVLLMACVMAALTVTSATAVGEAAPDSKCAPGATVEEFAVPTPGAGPIVITVGPDSNEWFTEFNAGKIARMRENGRITEFPIPTPDSRLDGIAAGPRKTSATRSANCSSLARSTKGGAGSSGRPRESVRLLVGTSDEHVFKEFSRAPTGAAVDVTPQAFFEAKPRPLEDLRVELAPVVDHDQHRCSGAQRL